MLNSVLQLSEWCAHLVLHETALLSGVTQSPVLESYNESADVPRRLDRSKSKHVNFGIKIITVHEQAFDTKNL